MSAVLEITNEVACDLMVTHLDTILALLDRPLPRQEVLNRVGSPKALERLMRHGLVHEDGHELRAVASVYHQLRQEGMMTFLERFVLPSLVTTESDGDLATLSPLYLKLTDAMQRGLRAGQVQRLFDALTVVSDEPPTGPVSRFTVMVIGTSRIVRQSLGLDEEVMQHVREAARQRATAAEKELALLSQYVFLADPQRCAAARVVVDEFVRSLDEKRTSSVAEATYHLTVATHWRSAMPANSERLGE